MNINTILRIISYILVLCALHRGIGKFEYLKKKARYTPSSDYEQPVYIKNTVYEGHLVGFAKVRYERTNWQLGYVPKSKVQNLGHKTNLSLRVKTAKLYKKTYYHSF